MIGMIGNTAKVEPRKYNLKNLNVQKIALLSLTGVCFTHISIFIMYKTKFKPYTGITWSLLELAGLLEDEESHVHFGKIKRHLALHPIHLTNLSVALNEILCSNLNSYDSELQGFLLACKNPKLLATFGDTFYDSCFIHTDIEADFYVFRPEVGCAVKGIVNKKGFNHIGVLVHKAFNVSIPKTSDPEWPGDLIEIGQEVKFRITHIDLTGRLPFIRGSINRADFSEGCKLLNKTKTTKGKKTTNNNESFYDRGNESDNSCDSNVEYNNETLSQKKKLKELEKQVSSEKNSKKKKRKSDEDVQYEKDEKHSKKRLKISEQLNHSEYKIENNVSYESSNDNESSINNTDNDTSSKKKKRSEKSSKKKSLEGSQTSESEFDYSTVKIKVEKDVTSNSDSENTTEIESKKREKKSKRQSKKLKYCDNTNGSIDSEEIQKDVKLEHKGHSKKHKLPDSNIDDSEIEIKVEDSPKSNNTEYPLDNDRNDKISKIVKKEKSPSISNRSRNDTENENYPNGLLTKHKRKREKTPMVEEFDSVTIKEEDLDSFDYTPQSNKSPRKSKQINIKSEPEDVTIKVEKDEKNTRERSVEGKKYKTSSKKRSKNESFKNSQSDYSTAEEPEVSPKKRSKKSKEPKYEILPENVEVKIERSSSVESLRV